MRRLRRPRKDKSAGFEGGSREGPHSAGEDGGEGAVQRRRAPARAICARLHWDAGDDGQEHHVGLESVRTPQHIRPARRASVIEG